MDAPRELVGDLRRQRFSARVHAPAKKLLGFGASDAAKLGCREQNPNRAFWLHRESLAVFQSVKQDAKSPVPGRLRDACDS